MAGQDIIVSAWNANGTSRTISQLANEGDTDGDQSDPAITALPNGYFAVSWTSKAGTVGASAIKVRVFAGSGAPLGGVFTIDTANIFGNVDQSALVAGFAGQFMATWSDTNRTSPQFDPPRTVNARMLDFRQTTIGDASNETLNGIGLRDIISAGGGNDTINGGRGPNTINGGAGFDTLIVGQVQGNYALTHNADGSVTIAAFDLPTGGENDLLTNVELVQFQGPVSIRVATQNDFTATSTSSVLFRNAATGDAGYWQIVGGPAQWHPIGVSSPPMPSSVKATSATMA